MKLWDNEEYFLCLKTDTQAMPPMYLWKKSWRKQGLIEKKFLITFIMNYMFKDEKEDYNLKKPY